MNRMVPHPLLSVGLVLIWLMLTRITVGNFLLGMAIALIAGWAMGALQPERVRMRRWDLILRLAFVVAWDILRCNAEVAWLLLFGGRGGRRKSGFVAIPLTLRNPAGLGVLSIIITATPGTAWLEYDQDSGVLLLHVFNLREASDWSGLIRARYEAPLLEIFR